MRSRARSLATASAALAGAATWAWAQPADYVGHPKLLFAAADVASLRLQLADGGDDDAAYAAVRTWAGSVLPWPTTALAGSWEGVHSVPQLGLAAQVEEDGSPYAARCRDVALYLARTRAPDSDDFSTALRLFSMAMAYDLAFAGATTAERAELRGEMRAYLDYMPPRFNYYRYAYNPYTGNHGLTVGAAMGLAICALWDDVPASAQDSLRTALAFADTLVAKCLRDVLPADGAYREGVLYAGWILRMAAPYFEARRRHDGTDFGADPRLQRLVEWLCYELLPEGGGRTHNMNDASWSSRPLALHGTVLSWAQARFASPLARYLYRHVLGEFGHDHGVYADRIAAALWARPLAAVDPGTLLPAGRVFPERGLYVYRSGWKTGAAGDEILFTFFSGKFYGGHAQEDQNQFALAAYGERLIVDCGPAGASSTPKETQAHNLVLVDGRGQHNAGNSIGTDGALVSTLVSGFADFVHGDARAAYTTYSPFNAPGVPFPASDWSWGYDGGTPVLRADRRIVVARGPGAPPWMLVADDIDADGAAHAYDWLLHTQAGFAVDTSTNPVVVQGTKAALDVFFAHPQALGFTVASFVHGGTDPATLRLAARAVAAVPRFCVALVPRPAGTPPAAFTAADDGAATTLAVDWGGVRDVAVANPAGAPAAGEIETDARLALVRHDGASVRGWLAGDATYLRRAGLVLLVVAGERASAALAGDTLHLSRADVAFRAWGPQVTSVVGPGGPVRFLFDGDHVRSPLPTDAAERPAPALHIEALPSPARGGGATLRFRVPAGGARLWIADARGRRVATLVDAALPAGTHARLWDARRAGGGAAGVYIAVLEAAGERRACKIALLP